MNKIQTTFIFLPAKKISPFMICYTIIINDSNNSICIIIKAALKLQ